MWRSDRFKYRQWQIAQLVEYLEAKDSEKGCLQNATDVWWQIIQYPISEKKNSFMTSLHSCVSTKHFFLFILNDENHQVPLNTWFSYTSIPIEHSDNFKKCAFTYPQNQHCLHSICQIKNKSYYHELIIMLLWFRENSKWQ